jgi:2-polyprenyl-3-methyl-5-hydroxy-6-metoxy-1,4-benzoquinol methylase
MSALTRYYEGEDYFAHLTGLDSNRAAGASRNLALHALLGAAPAGLDILDAGCGLGGFSHPLHGANRTTGVDINERCLAAVAEKWGYATLRFDLEEKWPIAPSSFDLILFGDVLEHLFSTAEVLSRASAALRPHGRIAIAVPNVGYWRRRLRLLFRGELAKDHAEHIRFFSPDSLARVARSTGLQAVDYRPYAWNAVSIPRLPVAFAWGFVVLLRCNGQGNSYSHAPDPGHRSVTAR